MSEKSPDPVLQVAGQWEGMRSFTVDAFAKINLSLLVLGKRGDGYHELRTVFQTISLADRIGFAWRKGRKTEIRLEDAAAIPDNLMLRAAERMLEALGVAGRLEMRLEKKIPMGGGLGGGSADAASVVRALPALTGRPLGREKMLEIAMGLGSDVPFFLEGGTALGMGRGEELYPLPDPQKTLGLLVLAGVHVGTPAAYKALQRKPLTELTPAVLFTTLRRLHGLVRSLPGQRVKAWASECENDFEDVVFLEHPNLAELFGKLNALGARLVRMTGSGSALFGLFDSAAQVRRAQRSFGGTVRAVPFRFLGRAEYERRWQRQIAKASE
jgi:4-diphosphocytidyl-2-C-methyl-D-erythritol kinase